MSIKHIFFFCLISIIHSCIIAQTSADLIVFTLVKNDGNHYYSLIVGTDAQKVNDAYNAPDIKRDRQFNMHKYVVASKIQKHLSAFVEKHCMLTNGELLTGENVYYINSFIAGKWQKCYLSDKEEATVYFTEIKKWIEDSPYKGECKQMLLDFQAMFVYGNQFPLTPEQQKVVDEYYRKKK